MDLLVSHEKEKSILIFICNCKRVIKHEIKYNKYIGLTPAQLETFMLKITYHLDTEHNKHEMVNYLNSILFDNLTEMTKINKE